MKVDAYEKSGISIRILNIYLKVVLKDATKRASIVCIM